MFKKRNLKCTRDYSLTPASARLIDMDHRWVGVFRTEMEVTDGFVCSAQRWSDRRRRSCESNENKRERATALS